MENIESNKEKDILQLNIYNQNYTNKLINPFSKTLDKHTGVISFPEDDVNLDNKIDDFIQSESRVGFIRFMVSDITDFMYKYYIVNGKKNMYLKYFSLYQFQSGIIDISLSEVIRDVKFEIPSRRDATAYFFTETEVYGLYRNNSADNSDKLCIIAENLSSEIRTVNLLQENFKNGFNDNDIKIEIPINNLNENETINCNIFRCVSENTLQLIAEVSSIKNKDNFMINQAEYLTVSQYQNIGVDIPTEIEINFGGKFEIKLLPNTRVMYMFYAK